MKKNKSKPKMYNSYKCDRTKVHVNEYSTISVDFVGQMTEVDFPLHYNCIKVKITTSFDCLNEVVKDFIDFSKPHFSVILVQRIGYTTALLNVCTQKNLQYIFTQLHKFKCNYFCRSIIKIKY